MTLHFRCRQMGTLCCSTIERNVENDVGVLSYTVYRHQFSLSVRAGLKRHLFTTNCKQMDFFDFDDSHVVYSLKSSPSFAVHCLKTGTKLWELVPTVGLPNPHPHPMPIELRDFSDGLLLTNNLNGTIKSVVKFKNSFYHSGSNIEYFGLLRIWRLQKQETALVGSFSLAHPISILCARYFTVHC